MSSKRRKAKSSRVIKHPLSGEVYQGLTLGAGETPWDRKIWEEDVKTFQEMDDEKRRELNEFLENKEAKGVIVEDYRRQLAFMPEMKDVPAGMREFMSLFDPEKTLGFVPRDKIEAMVIAAIKDLRTFQEQKDKEQQPSLQQSNWKGIYQLLSDVVGNFYTELKTRVTSKRGGQPKPDEKKNNEDPFVRTLAEKARVVICQKLVKTYMSLSVMKKEIKEQQGGSSPPPSERTLSKLAKIFGAAFKWPVKKLAEILDLFLSTILYILVVFMEWPIGMRILLTIATTILDQLCPYIQKLSGPMFSRCASAVWDEKYGDSKRRREESARAVYDRAYAFFRTETMNLSLSVLTNIYPDKIDQVYKSIYFIVDKMLFILCSCIPIGALSRGTSWLFDRFGWPEWSISALKAGIVYQKWYKSVHVAASKWLHGIILNAISETAMTAPSWVIWTAGNLITGYDLIQHLFQHCFSAGFETLSRETELEDPFIMSSVTIEEEDRKNREQYMNDAVRDIHLNLRTGVKYITPTFDVFHLDDAVDAYILAQQHETTKEPLLSRTDDIVDAVAMIIQHVVNGVSEHPPEVVERIEKQISFIQATLKTNAGWMRQPLSNLSHNRNNMVKIAHTILKLVDFGRITDDVRIDEKTMNFPELANLYWTERFERAGFPTQKEKVTDITSRLSELISITSTRISGVGEDFIFADAEVVHPLDEWATGPVTQLIKLSRHMNSQPRAVNWYTPPKWFAAYLLFCAVDLRVHPRSSILFPEGSVHRRVRVAPDDGRFLMYDMLDTAGTLDRYVFLMLQCESPDFPAFSLDQISKMMDDKNFTQWLVPKKDKDKDKTYDYFLDAAVTEIMDKHREGVKKRIENKLEASGQLKGDELAQQTKRSLRAYIQRYAISKGRFITARMTRIKEKDVVLPQVEIPKRVVTVVIESIPKLYELINKTLASVAGSAMETRSYIEELRSGIQTLSDHVDLSIKSKS